ncbi:MAG: hypothetical protein ACYTF1_19355 [Planctomycetota bacterium]|jgi:hypothetical protein
MNEQLEVYKHSGKLGSSIIIVPIVSIIAALILSVAYSYANVYSPVAGYLSILLVIFYAFGIGVCISYAALLAKCRNTKFVVFVAFLTSLLAFYTQWVIFIYALLQRSSEPPEASPLAIFLQPGAVWEFARLINKEGWYSLRSFTPAGTILWVFWVIEFLIIVITIPASSVYAIVDRVFCERCMSWCRVRKNMFRLAIAEDEELLNCVSAGDIVAMEKLSAIGHQDAPSFQIDLHQCDTCNDTSTMQIKLITLSEEKDGKVKEQDEDLTPCYILDRQSRQQIESLAKRSAVADDE